MEMKEDTLVCMPWADNRVSGAVKSNCKECGQDVGLAPTSQRAIAQKPMRIICLPCLQKELRDGEEFEMRLAASPSEVAAEILLGGLGRDN